MFQEKLEIEVNFKVRILGLLEFLNQKIILATMCIFFSLQGEMEYFKLSKTLEIGKSPRKY